MTTTYVVVAVIADGLGQSQAIGLTQTLPADANQALAIPQTLLTTQPLKAGTLEMPVPVSQMTSVTAAVNAIGPGLQLVHGTIQMPHAGANQFPAIALTQIEPLTTQTRQTVQILSSQEHSIGSTKP